jgi:hypothetical protein
MGRFDFCCLVFVPRLEFLVLDLKVINSKLDNEFDEKFI